GVARPPAHRLARIETLHPAAALRPIDLDCEIRVLRRRTGGLVVRAERRGRGLVGRADPGRTAACTRRAHLRARRIRGRRPLRAVVARRTLPRPVLASICVMTVAAAAAPLRLVGRRRSRSVARSASARWTMVCTYLCAPLVHAPHRSAGSKPPAARGRRCQSPFPEKRCQKPLLAARELVEGAELAVRRPILVEERQLTLVELLEELAPRDGLEILVVLVVIPGERDSEQ